MLKALISLFALGSEAAKALHQGLNPYILATLIQAIKVLSIARLMV